ncbi:hypothetical protein [Protaetiibacter intestinalis]|uniref:Glycosyltransferase RgtA/B/C/D-like domain-containing protein n=1 Tax=Protaetiibacter intestinalis TaxID=2419774 RepID=A0A387B560_9MICO|nr:hypothetical protein [Protaetiibacter intestinalis]AYF97543.1 hypothetical protein D7I47_04225 [Protaetiibacter intestinalis]
MSATGTVTRETWGPSRRDVAAELLGIVTALALAVVVAAFLAEHRPWLLFADGDSLVNVLVVTSIALGQQQDWAMSPVLFLPEATVHGLLSAFGFGVRETLALGAVVNLLALYGALRIAAGARRHATAPVTGALVALAVVGLLVVLEGGDEREGLQLAWMIGTTTYYSATVVAGVASLGLIRRALEARHRPWAAIVGLAIVSAVSVLSNPIHVAWTVVPALLVLGAVLAGARLDRARVGLLALSLIGGSLIGWTTRLAFADVIVADGANYLRPGRWADAARHYAEGWAQNADGPGGIVWQLVLLACWIVAVVLALRVRQGTGAWCLAAIGAVTPPFTLVWAVVLGTDADRYLQPLVYAPVAALVLLPALLAGRVPASARRAAVAVATGLALVAGIASAPVLVTAAQRTDADLACVTDWVDASGRVGAGQFWTVRAPKAYLADPSRLLQLDAWFQPYTWLVNRADFTGARPTFLVVDERSQPFQYPQGITESDAVSVACGRYTILDFGRELPLGTPHS